MPTPICTACDHPNAAHYAAGNYDDCACSMCESDSALRAALRLAAVPHDNRPSLDLANLVSAIAQHYDDHPTHGVGCSCMDAYSIAVARTLNPLRRDYAALNMRTAEQRRVDDAITYVIRMALVL